MYSGEAGDRGGWDGEAPPLIIPVDLGGRRLVGAGDWGDWDGGRMGCSGSCRRGSGAGVGRGFSGNEQLGVL